MKRKLNAYERLKNELDNEIDFAGDTRTHGATEKEDKQQDHMNTSSTRHPR